MAVRQEAAELIKAGYSPIEVAGMMHKGVQGLQRLLFWQVGEGELRLSDIFLSIPESRRRQYDEVIGGDSEAGQSSAEEQCRARGLDENEFQLYALSKGALHDDMYGYLRNIEVSLHESTRRVLESAFRAKDDDWWYEGVPKEVREDCAKLKEADAQHLERYAYTTLIHLKKIIAHKWDVFSDAIPKKTAHKKKEFLGMFDRLNRIRNDVMHPVKRIDITEEEFRFIRDFPLAFMQEPKATNLDVAKWMVSEFHKNGRLDQREAVRKIANTFGKAFVCRNPNGNPSIIVGVRQHFLRMTQDEAVWVKDQFCWRKRKPSDPKGKRSVGL